VHSSRISPTITSGSVQGILLAACALLAVSTASAASSSPIKKIAPLETGLTVATVPATAGAHHVRLTATFRYPMQCGYPGAGPLVVVLPKAAVVPAVLPSGSVLLGGKPIAARAAGSQITVTIPPPTGPMCNVIGPGVLRLTFTAKAGLGNPPKPGKYRVGATHARRSFSAALTIC
jgi:hypothetical protein